MFSYRDKLYVYIKEKYKCEPEYLWRSFPGYAVFRHDNNRKWFAAIMDIMPEKLGIEGAERVDVLNVKTGDPVFTDVLLGKDGYFKAYHMNVRNSVSIILDGTVPFSEICGILDESFSVTSLKKKD